MSDKLFEQWTANWTWMEAIARQREWELTPLKIAAPATEAQLEDVERRHGLQIPLQLRTMLSQHSSHVAFGWYIPRHHKPMEQLGLPTMSANRSAVWDLTHIDTHANPNFVGWKRELATRELSEAPNTPAMWENQFPFYNLINGDMLTIDMSNPDPELQPIRYFSHELEMIHGLALAPNFVSYITEMSKLGHAGTEWASMMLFSDGQIDDRLYLRADSAGGAKWLAWLAEDPSIIRPDQPPAAIIEKTKADRVLLLSARQNREDGVSMALQAGANVDCVFHTDWLGKNMAWDEEFCTALTYAVRAENIAMIEMLLSHGATLNTKRLPLDDAALSGSLEMVRWLIAKGARVDGWAGQRHWPIHLLITRREEDARLTKDEYRAKLINGGWPRDPAAIEQKVAQHIDMPTLLAMLEALLAAGARPDAPWDNGITMLAWSGADVAEVLLRYGASIHRPDTQGWNVMRWAKTPEKLRLLAAHGADINALPIPVDGVDRAYTALQAALMFAVPGRFDLVNAMLDLGADPTINDAKGRTSLAFCCCIEAFELIAAHGLDPHAPQPGGNTLLHTLLTMSWPPRVAVPAELAYFEFLLGLGIDINARNDDGQTVLHLAASRASYDESSPDFEWLIAKGADRAIKDNNGKRAYHLVSKSLSAVRQVLK